MRPINLIPPEDRRGERAPLRSGPFAYVVVGALLLLFGGVYVLVSTGNTISERKSAVASLEQQLASTQARAEALQSFTEFASLEQSRTETVSTLARSRFDWERVMRELALVIPSGVSLSSLTGSVSPEAGGQEGGAGTEIEAPSMTMNGCAPGHEAIAELVAALRDIDGVTRVGLTSSDDSGAADSAGATTTTSSDSGASCADPELATFDIAVAFDGVQIDSATGGITPPAPESIPGDDSGVAAAKAEQEASRESAESAGEKGRDAVETFVPGT